MKYNIPSYVLFSTLNFYTQNHVPDPSVGSPMRWSPFTLCEHFISYRLIVNNCHGKAHKQNFQANKSKLRASSPAESQS